MKRILIIIFLLLIPINIKALTYPELNSKKGLVYDLTDNKLLYEKNSEEISNIASLTKIMTTIVAIENISDLKEIITITNEMISLVRWDASVAGLKVGDKVTYEDLLYASILPSGADATIALALSTSGSIKNFTDKMNAKALELGMTNTHYVNVTGLDEEGHYSTAKDVLTLLQYALSNPLFKEIYTTKNYMLVNNLIVYSTISSYNKTMNLDTKRILGSKTGFTQGAGYCISALINSDNHEMIIILLKAERVNNISYNIKDTLDLISFIDDNYNDINLVNKDDVVHTLQVENSKIDTYDIKTKLDISLFLPIDYLKEDVKIKYDGLEVLSFKNKVGERLGKVSYYYQDELIKEEDIYLEEEIEFNLKKYLENNKSIVYIGLISFILIVCFIIWVIRKIIRH